MALIGRHLRKAAPGRWLSGVALATVLGVGASAQTWSNSAQSVDDLRYRLGVIDAELATIRAQLGQVEGGGAAPAASGGAATADVARLEAELRRLTGQVEQLGFRLDQISADATRRFGDIEFRLTELEGGDISAVGEPVPLGGGGTGAGANPGRPAAEVSVSESEDFDRAVNDIRQGRFDVGEDRLRRFLADYPGSPLEGSALFWLGESQFVRGLYQEAARSYLGGYNANRQGESAPQSLMKLGVTLNRLGQQREACLTLNEVSRQFPNAAEAVGEAAAEAASIGCG